MLVWVMAGCLACGALPLQAAAVCQHEALAAALPADHSARRLCTQYACLLAHRMPRKAQCWCGFLQAIAELQGLDLPPTSSQPSSMAGPIAAAPTSPVPATPAAGLAPAGPPPSPLLGLTQAANRTSFAAHTTPFTADRHDHSLQTVQQQQQQPQQAAQPAPHLLVAGGAGAEQTPAATWRGAGLLGSAQGTRGVDEVLVDEHILMTQFTQRPKGTQVRLSETAFPNDGLPEVKTSSVLASKGTGGSRLLASSVGHAASCGDSWHGRAPRLQSMAPLLQWHISA